MEKRLFGVVLSLGLLALGVWLTKKLHESQLEEDEAERRRKEKSC